MIALPVPDRKAGNRSSEIQKAEISEERSGTELEARLQAVLEDTEGVGRTRVLLMTGEDKGFYSSGNTEVTGVLIVAEGADNSVTVQNIQQAVMALFQIEAHKIKIMKMK